MPRVVRVEPRLNHVLRLRNVHRRVHVGEDGRLLRRYPRIQRQKRRAPTRAAARVQVVAVDVPRRRTEAMHHIGAGDAVRRGCVVRRRRVGARRRRTVGRLPGRQRRQRRRRAGGAVGGCGDGRRRARRRRRRKRRHLARLACRGAAHRPREAARHANVAAESQRVRPRVQKRAAGAAASHLKRHADAAAPAHARALVAGVAQSPSSAGHVGRAERVNLPVNSFEVELQVEIAGADGRAAGLDDAQLKDVAAARREVLVCAHVEPVGAPGVPAADAAPAVGDGAARVRPRVHVSIESRHELEDVLLFQAPLIEVVQRLVRRHVAVVTEVNGAGLGTVE